MSARPHAPAGVPRLPRVPFEPLEFISLLTLGLVAGIATWLIAGVIIADGWAALLAAAVVALSGVVALLVWSPLLAALRTLQGRFRRQVRGSGLDELLAAARQAE